MITNLKKEENIKNNKEKLTPFPLPLNSSSIIDNMSHPQNQANLERGKEKEIEKNKNLIFINRYFICSAVILIVSFLLIFINLKIYFTKRKKKDYPNVFDESEFDDSITIDTIIVGIDFGSTYSGYCFKRENEKTYQVYFEPTEILLSKTTEKYILYGNKEHKELDRYINNKNILYFEGIKPELDPKKEIVKKEEITINSKNYPKEKIELKIVIRE